MKAKLKLYRPHQIQDLIFPRNEFKKLKLVVMVALKVLHLIFQKIQLISLDY
jgi:hypothetical protein